MTNLEDEVKAWMRVLYSRTLKVQQKAEEDLKLARRKGGELKPLIERKQTAKLLLTKIETQAKNPVKELPFEDFEALGRLGVRKFAQWHWDGLTI